MTEIPQKKATSPVIAMFLQSWKEGLDDAGRQRLRPYTAKVAKTTEDLEMRRAWMVTDWLVRVQTPAWLEFAGHTDEAAALRALPEITDTSAAKKSYPKIKLAREKAIIARNAAWAAGITTERPKVAGTVPAWSATDAAALAAARDAARDVVWDADTAKAATWSSVRDIAINAAWDVAWNAARYTTTDTEFEPTVTSLQASALDLLDRMIAVS